MIKKITLLAARAFFDKRFYYNLHQDIRECNLDPWEHYVSAGWNENRLICRQAAWLKENFDFNPFRLKGFEKIVKFACLKLLFDRTWYLSNYPEVSQAGIDPWKHFVSRGRNENRLICWQAAWLKENFDFNPFRLKGFEKIVKFACLKLLFDRKWYLSNYPEVSQAGIDPWKHFVRFGKKEGKLWSKSSHEQHLYREDKIHHKELTRYLSSTALSVVKSLRRKVAIIIPVYRGFLETQKCLESVIRHNYIGYRILVINDQSPEVKLVNYLESLASENRIEYFSNDRNVGFVQSVNLGMKAVKDADVILLNSDTEVHGDWVERLSMHAYSRKKIGTVTPFSNNATICSWPSFQGDVMYGPIAEVDRAFNDANRGRSISIPTAVGFCMYIRRDCLNEIGYFNAKVFGRGYGEENDFCLKASRKGWLHLHALDVFVFHQGETSFGTHSPEKRNAGEIIRNKYPEYELDVQKYIAGRENEPYKFAASAEFAKQFYPERILCINHAAGGGADKFLREYIEKNKEKVFFAEIQPFLQGVKFSIPSFRDHPENYFTEEQIKEILSRIIDNFNFSKVLANHFLGVPHSVLRIIQELNVAKEFIVHDYHTICPRIHLAQKDKDTFCGIPPEPKCDQCIIPDLQGVGSIAHFRKTFKFLYEAPWQRIAPLQDVADNVRKVHPHVSIMIRPHLMLSSQARNLRNPYDSSEIFNIGVLGLLQRHKGRDRVISILETLRPSDRIKITTIGKMIPSPHGFGVWLANNQIYEETGQYKNDHEAEKIIQLVQPHVFWFPVGIPETFSYTLHLALESGLPIVGPDLPFFKERTIARPFTFYLKYGENFDPKKAFLEIREQLKTLPKRVEWEMDKNISA